MKHYRGPNGRISRHNPDTPDIAGPPMRAFTPFEQLGFDHGRLHDPNQTPPPVPLDVRGKIGQTVFQKSIPPPWCTWYPRVPSLQRRRHVIPRDPRTLAQLRCRARWAAGVAAFKQLSPDEAQSWADKARTGWRQLSALQEFMKYFCTIHPTSEYTVQALLWSAQPELPFITES